MLTLPAQLAATHSASSMNTLKSGNRMRQLVANYDWTLTSLGPFEGWPASLKATVTLMMDSIEPMVIWWGDESIQIYNDAYSPRVDHRNGSAALGQPASVSWKQGWETIRPLVRQILDGAPSVAYSNFSYSIMRDGWTEDTFWDYSFTPVRDDAGTVRGVLLLSEETTSRHLALRRQRTLEFLREELHGATSVDELEGAIERAVAFNPNDLYRVKLFSLRGHELSQEVSPRTVCVTAPEVGFDIDLALVFDLSPTVALNAPYRQFLDQFTMLLASARHRIDNEAQRLLVEAERDRLLLDAPVGAAVMIGEELVYHLVNPIYAMVSGRPADSMVGRPFVEVFPELLNSPVHGQFKAAYHAGEPFISQPTLVQIHRHGGKLDDRYFTYNLSPLRALTGDVYGLMVIAVDITVEVAARAQVEKLNLDLQAAAGAKDEFLALLGHELRNPLSPIVTALELMRLRDHTTEREQIIIRRQVAHLTRLVDDLLDVSRITRGKVELRNELVDVSDVLTSAVEMVAPLALQRHQQLHFDIVPTKWYGDPARLAQIVSNLLTNASRYSHSGAHIYLRTVIFGDELTIEVSDNGAGLSADVMPRIFEPFFQGERKLHSSVGGLGIGLALVKNLTELHGGRVMAASEGPGKGSKFTVHLPLNVERVVVQRQENPAAAPLAGRHQQILVVDDNEDAADMLAEALRLYGHAVTIAYTSEAALQLFVSQEFDLAILDIGLPEISGHELAVIMRETGHNVAMRYVALTGFGQEVDKERSAAAGFTAHLVKPLKLEELETLFRDG